MLLNGFDNSCGLRSPTDTSPAYYTVVDVREGCVGCRDLCTRTPDGACLAYQCTSAGSRCELWKRTPCFGQKQPGAECWVKLDAGTHPFEEVARLEQLESLGRAGVGGAPATASDMYKGARYVPPFPPPARPQATDAPHVCSPPAQPMGPVNPARRGGAAALFMF